MYCFAKLVSQGIFCCSKTQKFKDCSIVFLITPLDCWLIIHSENEIGEKLKEILPQEQRDKKGEVAYIDLTAVASVVHVAQAVELVEEVLAEAPVQTRVRAALINVLLTPGGKTANSQPLKPGIKCVKQAHFQFRSFVGRERKMLWGIFPHVFMVLLTS